MQRSSKPIAWRISGVTDSLDASMAPPGSMQLLINLIPDPSTRNIWTCRPASTKLLQMTLPINDTISTWRISGTILYGMVKQTTGANTGYDAPFAFNLVTQLPIAVTGAQTPTTLPLSQPTSGAWIPPQMDLIGTKMMVAHPGFTGAGGGTGNWVGWFDLTNPLAPVWNAGNMGGAIVFTTAPIAVRQFFNRAYYIHNLTNFPAVIFSDALAATNATNANQIITFGDNTPLTALGQLPLTNQLGGIIQSLMVFKNTSNIYQISGDPGLNNLFVNSLNVATGTLCPNSICATPKGLAFCAPDGIRIIGFDGTVQDPIGYQGQGVTVPFVFTAQPTRVDAACNGNLMRISTQNGQLPTQPQQDWWYDFGKGCWTGPHTFPAALALPYQQTFIIAPIGVPASIWQSNFIQYPSSTFTENAVAMQWEAQTSLLPDTDMITNNTITEGSIDLAMPPTQGTVGVVFLNQNGTAIDQVGINPTSTGVAALWGTSVWGSFLWGGGGQAALAPYQLQWQKPMTFVRGSIQANANSFLNFKLGTIHLRYQPQRSLVNIGLAA